jgi:hypothetical protein
MRISRSNKRRTAVGRKSLIAAVAIAALAPAGAQAASSSVDASALFTRGGLTVTAPTTAVSFGSTVLDGRASYDLNGDIGDWGVNDATGDLAGWTTTASASSPKGPDGVAMTDAVMAMHVPTATGNGAAPTIATGDADGFVQLTGAGNQVLSAASDKGIGAWQLAQAGPDDIRLVMPYNTRAVKYDSTITFTIAQSVVI